MIDLTLPFPPSTNSYFRSGNGRRGYFIPKEVKAFRDAVARIVMIERFKPLSGRLDIAITLHGPNRRKYDIDNRIKAVGDALQHAGVFTDDETVDRILVERGPITNGGCVKVRIALHECQEPQQPALIPSEPAPRPIRDARKHRLPPSHPTPKVEFSDIPFDVVAR